MRPVSEHAATDPKPIFVALFSDSMIQAARGRWRPQIVWSIFLAGSPTSKNSGAAVRARIHFWFVLNQSSMLGQAKNNYL